VPRINQQSGLAFFKKASRVLSETNEDENVCSQTSSQISNVRFASEAESRSGSRTTNDFEKLAMPMFASVSDRFR
jgi:hypothetical protein